MNKRSPQEIADFFGCYVAQTYSGDWFVHIDKPVMHKGAWVSHTGIGFPDQMVEVPDDHDWIILYEPQGNQGKPKEDFPCSTERADSDNKQDAYSGKPADSDNKASHQSQVHVHQEYKVAIADHPITLTDMVNALIEAGWRPQGGVDHADNGFLCQAMVRGLE